MESQMVAKVLLGLGYGIPSRRCYAVVFESQVVAKVSQVVAGIYTPLPHTHVYLVP